MIVVNRLPLVNLEIAKLAKKLGFNSECHHAIDEIYEDIHSAIEYFGEPYFVQNDIDSAIDNTDYQHYLLPYQYQLILWLKDNYDIFLSTEFINFCGYVTFAQDLKFNKVFVKIDVGYEELEDSIELALTLTLKKLINEQRIPSTR